MLYLWYAIVTLLFIVVGTTAFGALLAAPWVPTRRRERDAVTAALPLRSGAKVYDLGCGDGAMLFAIADAYPSVVAVGYEVALLPLAFGWLRKWRSGGRYRNVSLRWRSFYGADVSDADMVFVFLMASPHQKLLPVFRAQLRDDAMVVLECWPFKGVAHTQKIGGADGVLPLYAYTGAALRK